MGYLVLFNHFTMYTYIKTFYLYIYYKEVQLSPPPRAKTQPRVFVVLGSDYH